MGMTDTGIVKSHYRQPHLNPYGNNRIVAAAQRQMSEGFQDYLEKRRQIDADRRIGSLDRIQRKIALLDETAINHGHDLSREEVDALARDNLGLLAVTDAHMEKARDIRHGQSNGSPKVYLDHIPLRDFVDVYVGNRRKFGGAILEEILGGSKSELLELLSEQPTMSGRHEMVIPVRNVEEFRRRFETYFKPEPDTAMVHVQEPANGNGKDSRETKEVRRAIEIGEWPNF